MRCSSNGNRPSAGDFKKNDVVAVTERLKIHHSTVAVKRRFRRNKKAAKYSHPPERERNILRLPKI